MISLAAEPLDFARAGRVPAPGDNVAIAVRTLPAGSRILARQLVFEIPHTILEGHRFALFRIRKGDRLLSWGLPFGVAQRDIEPGEYVCNQKILGALAERQVAFDLPGEPNFLDYSLPFHLDESRFRPGTQYRHEGEAPAFQGYARDRERGTGTRNYAVIIGTSARTGPFARAVAERFAREKGQTPNFDGVVAVEHTEGGGQEVPRNLDLTLRTLAGFMVHPNVGAVLCVDYGNESVSNAALARYLEEHSYPTATLPHRFLSIRGSYGGALDEAARQIEAWLAPLRDARREFCTMADLKLGLQCGGSDAFSGVSGNPLAGLLARDLVGWGGSANLAETDELIGAESYVLQNVRDLETARAFLQKIARFQQWAAWHGQSAEGNPSGGNMYRGLYNITIKSIGAARKKDPATRLDYAIDYGQRMAEPGFYFMDSPGNDLESIAGQVASGCNMILFSTGNGSITNFPFVPTIKIMTTTRRFELVRKEMDFNAGRYQDGESLENLGREAFEYLLEAASGRRTAGEKAGHAQVQLWREWRQDGAQPPPAPPGARAEPYVPEAAEGTPPLMLPTEKAALVLPTSLCSGQIARLIVDRLNASGSRRAVTLPHTEGCGNSGGEPEQLFLRTMASYLVHPLASRALLLEHGCEKTHNDAFRHVLRAMRAPEESFGFFSVQLDGGIESVTNKALEWIARQTDRPSAAKPGIAFAGSDIPPEVIAIFAKLASEIVGQGGFAVVPEGLRLFPEQGSAVTLRYGEAAVKSGVHTMECPTGDLVETLTGLGATGAQLLLVWENRTLVPGHPLIPTVQLAGRGLLPRPLEADVDVLLDFSADNGEELVRDRLRRLAAGEVPRNRALGNTAFQITRGYTGISL